MIINMNGAKAPETPSPVLQEKTVTPETLPVVIGADEGYDGLSQVTVNPDAQLKAENIRSGKSIFGVTGVFEGVNTGDALPVESLINEIRLDGTISSFGVRPISSVKMKYVKDDTVNTESTFISGSGLNTFNGVTITSMNSPQSIKKSYGLGYYKAWATHFVEDMSSSSSATTGKVTGATVDTSYDGSVRVYCGVISDLMRYAGQEYGVYEADMHVEGFIIISTSVNSAFDYISDSELPKAFSNEIHVKYSVGSSSVVTGILEITGLDSFEAVNYPVGYPYGEYTEHYIFQLITKAYLTSDIVKTGGPI